ncbi:MAG: transposase, partial [Bacteroidales bacterium]|nr:transposase [Bacteroidales bacterium]
PNIKANSKFSNNNISTDGKEKPIKKHKKQAKKKNIPVDKIKLVDVNKSQLPQDAKFKYYDKVITQDIIFKRQNTLYKIAVYYSPSEKKTYRGVVPNGASYHSEGLKSFIILQNKVCDVTSNKILTMLRSIGIEISAGSLSNILLEYTDLAQTEKQEILKAGLSHSYSQTDITGARVAGKNHYTHIITNDFFTSYTTLSGKSALDVLAAYQTLSDKKELGLIYSNETIKLLKEAKVSEKNKTSLNNLFTIGDTLNLQEFEKYIKEKIPDIYSKRNIFIKIKTAFALAYYHSQKDIPQSKCVVSDNAPEYNKIAMQDHALCWVHDARPYKKLSPLTEIFSEILEDFKNKYWKFYHKLLDYKDKPNEKKANVLSKEFDDLFTPDTDYFQLNQCISKTAEKKQELLTVLKHPEIPLHNNLAELGARRQVRKRDISLHTMTKRGTKNQDAFLTIGQTAIQLGVDVFKYIKEFIGNHKNRIYLADIIYAKTL